MFALLDLGLSNTLNRELARLSVLPGKEQEMNNLVRTLEVLYWGIAIFVGVTVVALSPFLANHWIKSRTVISKNYRTDTFNYGVRHCPANAGRILFRRVIGIAETGFA